MARSVIFVGAVLVLASLAGSTPSPVKRFSVDLGVAPEHRWDNIVPLFKDELHKLFEDVVNRLPLPKAAVPLLEQIVGDLDSYLPAPFSGEMKGVARAANLSLGDVVMGNLLYDFTAFCTSIVMEDNNGSIFHGRNLDYSLGSNELRATTVVVDYMSNGTAAYTATTYAGYVGVLTGMRPYGFSISVDERDQGALWENILAALVERKHFVPMSFLVRQTLHEENTFENAVIRLTDTPLIAPVYFIVGGTGPHQGAVITRDRFIAVDTYRLDAEQGRWYVLETNYDHWTTPPSSDDRRDPAEAVLNEAGRSKASTSLLVKALNTPPVLNKKTTYTTVMAAGQPRLYQAWSQNLS